MKFPFIASALNVVILAGLAGCQGQPPLQLDAAEGILSAFEKANIVALTERHGVKQYSDFRIKLIQHPEFPKKVDDILVEFGNSLYQSVLDRYIAGEQVPVEQLRQVWRNTTQIGGWNSPIYEEFFSAVRAVNQKLPKSGRLRVVAGDPPIDWTKIRTREDWIHFMELRGRHPVSVIEKEVLAKRRKALVIYGNAHYYRQGKARGSYLEEKHPGEVFLVCSMVGPYAEYPEIEARLDSKAKPSFFFLKGTPIGSLGANTLLGGDTQSLQIVGGKQILVDEIQYPNLKLEDLADGCVYLGSEPGILVEPDASIDRDPEYSRELERRRKICEP